MQQHTGRDQDDDASSSSSSPYPGQARRAPLVIVSERGRHTDESRRIVRAQAARASAAQSRVTRARNREEREGTVREDPVSPESANFVQSFASSSSDNPGNVLTDPTHKPLVLWLSNISHIPAGRLIESAKVRSPSPSSSISTPQTPASGASSSFGSFLSAGQVPRELRPQLPRAIPRGFQVLQQRIQISDDLVDLLSRTSCFDFDSPGVAERLHQLLFDLVIGYAGPSPLLAPLPGNPIQGHLRIACICVTLFQGLRANGAVFGYDNKYQRGLEAAWSEAMSLDHDVLQILELEGKKASLWAMFMLSVTTGATSEIFNQLLRRIFEELDLQHWSNVRGILLDFIYPGSFLDEPCKMFYHRLNQL